MFLATYEGGTNGLEKNMNDSGISYPLGAPPEAGVLREIVPGVNWLRLPLPLSLGSINVWLLADNDGHALVDCGIHNEETVALWERLLEGPLGGRRLTRVLATHLHPDHVGMAGWLTRESGCELWMTFGEYMNCRVLVADCGREAPPEGVDFYRRAGWDAPAIDNYRTRFGGYGRYIAELPQSYRRLRDGDSIRIGQHDWQVVVGAGHSPEHACFHCPDLKLLISGDQVLPRISSNVSVFPTEPAADPLELWLDSLEKLKRLVPDDVLVLPAHNEPFQPLHARLDSLDASHRRAIERLQQMLSGEPKRAVDLFGALFNRAIDDEVLAMATGECLANLNYLMRRGLASVTDDEHGVAWYSGA